jgi:hypothetical protein
VTEPLHPEIKAMSRLVMALKPIEGDSDACERVLHWARLHYVDDPRNAARREAKQA